MSEDNQDISPERADILMGYALEHYMKRHTVVLKKLGHAKGATQESIKELDVQDSEPQEAPAEREVYMAYDAMWEEIIKAFQDSGVSEDDLGKVEVVLTRIPSLIKKYYELRVQQDQVLQALITELDSEKYKEAISIIKKVQSLPDKLSGLDPREFELDQDGSAAKAFIMRPPNLRDTRH